MTCTISLPTPFDTPCIGKDKAKTEGIRLGCLPAARALCSLPAAGGTAADWVTRQYVHVGDYQIHFQHSPSTDLLLSALSRACYMYLATSEDVASYRHHMATTGNASLIRRPNLPPPAVTDSPSPHSPRPLHLQYPPAIDNRPPAHVL